MMQLRTRKRMVTIFFLANTLFWVYFWTAFALSSEPHEPRPWGHFPVDEHTFWGHSIGLTKSTQLYPFMRWARRVQFPSFVAVIVIENLFFREIGAGTTLLGISFQGWRLLVVMLVSFLQWYLVARILRHLCARSSGRTTR